MPRHRRGWAVAGGPGREERHTPLANFMLEPALLTLLKEQARHGYTLLSDLERLGLTGIHPSVVYRTLREMEALEWVESDWETDQTQGPPRRTYRLTGAGEEALGYWQHEMKRTQDLIISLLNR